MNKAACSIALPIGIPAERGAQEILRLRLSLWIRRMIKPPRWNLMPVDMLLADTPALQDPLDVKTLEDYTVATIRFSGSLSKTISGATSAGN